MPATCASSSPATPGHRGQVGALAEHGDGAGDRGRLARQPREPQQHGARDGARADRPHDVGVRGVGLDARRSRARSGAGGRAAGCRRWSCGRPRGTRGRARRRAGARRARRPPPRTAGRAARGRSAGSLAISASSAASVGASPVRTRRGDEHGLALQPAHEVGEEAQRRAVAPVQVVDLEQQRPLGGEVEREPVQAVQGGERGVAAGGRALVRALRRRRARARRRRRATSGSATTASKSWRTTPNGNSRSSSPARALST